MSSNNRIPRPRHLFPDVAAFFIQQARQQLIFTRSLRRAIGHIPVWTAGSLAGVAGIMLTALLFFLHDPGIQAAPSVVISTPVAPPSDPIPNSQPVQTVIPVDYSTPRPALGIDLFDTRLPFVWDQNQIARLSSVREFIPAADWRWQDLWRLASQHHSSLGFFQSYALMHRSPPFSEPGIVSSPVPTPLEKAQTLRGWGLLVEKLVPQTVAAGEQMTYRIQIRNQSQDVVEHLTVRERVSAIERVSQVLPPANVEGEELVWVLTGFQPGEFRTLEITCQPDRVADLLTETRVTSLSRLGAVVQVNSPAPAPTPVAPAPQPAPEEPKAPLLKLSWTPVDTLQQGDDLSLTFSVSNVGNGPAENITLYVKLSEQFQHRYGEYVKHEIRHLAPGETRHAILRATARDSGAAKLVASLTLAGNEKELRQLQIPIKPGTAPLMRPPARSTADRPASPSIPDWQMAQGSH